MTEQQFRIMTRINQFAEKALGDIDPQKVRISEQLETLRPVMEEVAREENMPVEDVFILYMDLASMAAIEKEKKFKEDFSDLDENGDLFIHS